MWLWRNALILWLEDPSEQEGLASSGALGRIPGLEAHRLDEQVLGDLGLGAGVVEAVEAPRN